jgi:ribonuclease HI
MSVPTPHFLLFSAARTQDPGRPSRPVGDGPADGRWTFILESADGSTRLEVGDQERGLGRQRLELLAVVRGLEALDQPSRVTLVTPSKYVRRGLRLGVQQWRENGWKWEFFGRMVPVRNADLWRRIDRALQIHSVRCRHVRFDPPQLHASPSRRTARASDGAGAGSPRTNRPRRRADVSGWLSRLLSRGGDWFEPRFRPSGLCAE